MKINVLTAAILCCNIVSCFGQNLVPNPSFEEYEACPSGDGQVYNAKYWNSFGNSPDYYNACSQIIDFLTPTNAAGYQVPKTGQAYIGGAFYLSNDTTNIVVRESIGTRLISPLTIGNTYYVRFYVSLADSPDWTSLVQNRLGAWFSTQSFAVDSFCPTPCLTSLLMPPNHAEVYTDSVITDTQNWVEISGSFVADSNYQYLAIGNFFSNDSVNISLIPNQPAHATEGSYYYVDDVYVGETMPSGIEKIDSDECKFFPNPANDKLYITGKDIKGKLFTLSGELVLEFNSNNQHEIDVTRITQGVYILTCNYEGKYSQSKVVIIH